jgi:DNA mismatch repair protein MutS2
MDEQTQSHIENLKKKTLTLLSFEDLKEELVSRTVSELGQNIAQSLDPDSPKVEPQILKNKIYESLKLLSTNHNLQSYIAHIFDPTEKFNYCKKDGILNGKDIFNIACFIESIDLIKNHLEKIQSKNIAPIFSSEFSEFEFNSSYKKLYHEIKKAFDPSGLILDEANPELYRLRKLYQEKRLEFEQSLKLKIKKWTQENILQDSFYDIQDGRYVVPVKVEMQSKIPGILHGRSNSEKSVFIEPFEITNANNELKEYEIKIQNEELKILKEFSKKIKETHEIYLPFIAKLSELDFAFAAAKFAIDFDCNLILEEKEEFNLINLFHPLLKVRPIIKNDLNLKKQNSQLGFCLIITGPNMGGKTVLLKSIGLAAILKKLGLPINANAESSLPNYENIIALIGDDQNIHAGLSSFSAQILDLKALTEIKQTSLILIDEILSSTSPDEGAALAQSLIEYFIKNGNDVVITTHFSELALKLKNKPNIYIASMSFKNDKPTYKLILNEAESSHAFEIALNLGLNPSIISNAKNFFSNEKLNYLELKKELEIEKQKHEEKYKIELETLELEKKTLQKSYEQKLLNLKEELQSFIEKTKNEINLKLEDFIKKFEAYKGNVNLNPTKTKEKILNFKQELEKNLNSFVIEKEKLKLENENKTFVSTKIQIGDKVKFLSAPFFEGTVIDIRDDKKEALIQVGNFKIEKKLSEIALIQNDKKISTTRAAHENFFDESIKVEDKIDLRGKFFEEAMLLAEQKLDLAFRARKPILTIITGHGSGALKNGLKDLLNNLTYIKSYRPENESNDGAWIVELDV